MKSMNLRLFAFFVCFVFSFAGACASGDFGDQGGQSSEADVDPMDDAAGRADADGLDSPSDANAPVDVTSSGDGASVYDTTPDSGDGDPVGDGGVGDIGPDAADPGLCATAQCRSDMVCDPATGDCVGCLSDADCAAGGVCDATTLTCVGCLSDLDCAAGEHCHDRGAVCVPSCCDNTISQPAFSSAGYSHNHFDIDVTEAGDPAIVFVDADTNTVKFAQPLQGQWMSQNIATLPNSTSVNIRLALDSAGNPHVMMTRYQMIKHLWRDGSGWQSEDLLADPPSVGYCDIAVDSKGGVHMIALIGYGDRILYSHKSAAGALSQQDLTLPAANAPVWTNLALTRDDRPIASFQIGLDKTAYIAEREPSGAWGYELAGQDVYQVHGLGVGPDNEPTLAYQRAEASDGLRLHRRRGQSWTDELIVADTDHGFTPDVAVDSLGDPHIVYMARGATASDNPLYYARWNGANWEHLKIDGVQRAFYPRVALDGARVAHVAVFDPVNDAITYLKIQ